MVSAWSALQTRAVHQQFQETLGHETSLANLQTSGKEFALIADTTLATGLVLNLTGAYLLHKAKVKNAAIEQLAGGQP